MYLNKGSTESDVQIQTKRMSTSGNRVGRHVENKSVNARTSRGVKSTLQCLARHTLVLAPAAVVHMLAEAFATRSQLVPLCSG